MQAKGKAALAVVSAVFTTGASGALAQTDCSALRDAAPEGVAITEVSEVPAGEEAPVDHCLLRGVMDERTGSDGRPYALRFELRLPEDWSGRFLHQFNGGNDGRVVPAFGARDELPDGDGALARGFAVVSSDAGHDGSANPDLGLAGSNAFGLEYEARRDYGYDAVATLHPVALDLVETYYGRPPDYVYGMGGSNGGRHAMIAAERMPDVFDGFYVAYPGFNLPRAAIQHAWDVQSFLGVGDTLQSAFSRDELDFVASEILAACDGLDGIEDGLILSTMDCQVAFEPEAMVCADGETEECLAEEKVAALVRIHGGPLNSEGDQLYAPWPWDTGIASPNWRFWKLESTVPPWENQPLIAVMGAGSLAQVFTTPPTVVAGDPASLQAFLEDFDFDEDAPKIDATSNAFPESAMEIMTPPNSDNPTLAAFKQAGGKMLIHHGTSDPVFSFLDTVDWYEKLLANDPDAADFVRLYPVPGMPHGPGGIAPDQFDMLSALIAWVEEGESPGPLVAMVRPDRQGIPEGLGGDTRLLCPWPSVAVFDGQGSGDRAESFVCEDRN
jgi:hypothetical protein